MAGYESRRASESDVFVMIFALSRDRESAHKIQCSVHRSSTLVVISALFVSFLRVFKHYILIISPEIYIYVMPGVNCSVFSCGSCKRTKGMGIWKLPLAKDEAHGKWRDEWLGEIKKTREMDQNFREQLKNDRIYTCERHFAPEDIEICKYTYSFDCVNFICVFRIFLDGS